MSDFVFTLDSEPEDGPTNELAVPRKSLSSKKSKTKKPAQSVAPVDDELALDPEFNFDIGGQDLDGFLGLHEDQDVVKTGSKPTPISVDEIIERRRANKDTKSLKRKRDPLLAVQEVGNSDEESNEDEAEKDEDEEDEEESFGAAAEDWDLGEGSEEDPLESSGAEDDSEHDNDEEASNEEDNTESDAGSASEEEETQAEKDRKTAFFAEHEDRHTDNTASFASLNLSRPLVRALTALSFSSPTPIQASAIPVALEGHDVLGSAVTGSGKTAAFMIPTLERLMYRDRSGSGEIRVVVLVPTRELAVQCAEVGKSLSRYTDITFGLIVGGLSVKAQETTLRSRPDIIIATPGRLIDHLQNTPSFSLNAIDILILDEADRMLSDGFAAELQEIITACPKSRQTMLFSATMTDDVDSLVRLSMNRPVRLFVDPKKSLARGLVQEFVRVKREPERQAILLVLCSRTAKRNTIVFFRSKKLCHQMRVVFGVLGLRAAELHGDLTQEQRLLSLRKFREGEVDYLLATDLASRGLDIKGMETVINFDMPSQIELYLHRVGRTARAGERGRSITLVGEADRSMLKAAMKRSESDKVRHRLIPDEAVKKMLSKLEDLKDEISEVLKEEQEEKAIRRAEMELTKGVNMIEHRDEILSRPKKTWFTTAKEKANAESLSKQQYEAGFDNKEAKGASGKARSEAPAPKRDKFAGLSRKAKRRKLAAEADKEFNDEAAVASAIRAAKRAEKPRKIGEYDPKSSKKGKRGGREKKKSTSGSVKTKILGKGPRFDRDLGVRASGSSREGVRAKKGDGGILGGKKGGKGKSGGKKKA